MQIQSDIDWSQTRAIYENNNGASAGNGDFVHGNEHNIDLGSSFFIFFNEDGTLFSSTPIRDLEPLDETLWLPKEEDVDNEGVNYLEKGYLTKIYPAKNAVSEDDMWPKKCLLVLNAPSGLRSRISNMTLNEILGETLAESADPRNLGRPGGLFTMTNAVVNGQNVATEITPKNIVSIKELVDWYKDEDGDGVTNRDNILRVKVERMVAKFTFDIADENRVEGTSNVFQPITTPSIRMFTGTYDEKGAPVSALKKWRIEVTGWNVNALETKSHLFKQNNSGDFADTDHYRSYWSRDPHYDNDEQGNALTYPWQYRKAIDYNLVWYDDKVQKDGNGNIQKDGNGNIIHTNLLRNYSFDELVLGKPEPFNANEALGKIVYAPENTYDAAAVQGQHDKRDEMLACTHLLVGAELQIEKTAEGEYQALDLYRDRNGLYYETERVCIASLVHDINQALTSQHRLRLVYYNWENESETGVANNSKWVQGEELLAITGGNYSLYYKPNNNQNWVKLTEEKILDENLFSDEDLKMAVATLRKGDGKRLPWIATLVKENRLAVAKATDETLTEAQLQRLKIYKILRDNQGNPILGDYGTLQPDNSTERIATYNAIKSLLYEWLGPVDHFNNGKMYYACGIDNPIPTNDGLESRYGVVRNSWYQFNLNNIKSIGIPVDDVDQPIVPERVGLNDQINVTVRILGWHETSTTVPIL